MRVLFAFIRIACHKASIYRLDFWASLLSGFVMMYASYSIWAILYRQSPNAFGMNLEHMTTYGVLGALLVPIMNSAMLAQHYIAQQVRMGTLEIDLMKPLDFIFHMFCRSVGEFSVQLLTHGVPSLLFAYFFLKFPPPQSPKLCLCFVVSFWLGYVVFFEVNLLMGMLAIVTLDIRSYTWAFNSLVRFASGQMVPLWMFPTPVVAFALALPFKDVYFVPMSIYIGAYEGDLAQVMLSQAAWVIGLFLLVRLLWSRLQRRITIQGG